MMLDILSAQFSNLPLSSQQATPQLVRSFFPPRRGRYLALGQDATLSPFSDICQLENLPLPTSRRSNICRCFPIPSTCLQCLSCRGNYRLKSISDPEDCRCAD